MTSWVQQNGLAIGGTVVTVVVAALIYFLQRGTKKLLWTLEGDVLIISHGLGTAESTPRALEMRGLERLSSIQGSSVSD